MQTELILKSGQKKKLDDSVEKANALIVKDNSSNEVAANFVKVIKVFQKEISNELNPAIEDAHSLHKKLVAQRNKFLEPLKEAESLVKSKMSDFFTKQERIRAEAQRKADLAAAEEERKKKEALDKRIEKAKEQGKEDKVEILEQAKEEVHVPTNIVPETAEKQAGIAKKVNWKFRIINEKDIPREYLKVDDVRIGQIVRAMKGNTNIPGIKVYADESVSVRT